jgi:tyrosinase
LSWHRYFTYLFEQALRNECGYTGYQPYWNWGKSAFDPLNSPYMDGGPLSMSGNGVYEKHNQTNALPTGLNPIPPGQGGGCVNSGPFKNLTVNLGPVSPTLAEPEVVAQKGNGLDYNPRCLKRDISSWVSSQWNKDNDTYSLITQNKDIVSFQTVMQGIFDQGFYGVHTGGHFTYQGDPAGDLFASPGDPMFFLHHGQIDRTWWIWQNQDLANRQNAIGGTITLNNYPPSRNGVLTDTIYMGTLGPPVQIKDIMDTTGNKLCYIYI